MNKKYLVYIEQINQTCFEVEASSEKEACKKARSIWDEAYACPEIISVEELGTPEEN